MASKAGARDKLTLACEECKQRNYQTYKNKKNDPDRLELKKYCRFCHKHTNHKETILKSRLQTKTSQHLVQLWPLQGNFYQ